MRHDSFSYFTIFKRNFNADVTIIIDLFDVLWATMASDDHMLILGLIETMCFYEHCEKYRNSTKSNGTKFLSKQTISTVFSQLTQKSPKTVRPRKIFTPENWMKLGHLKSLNLRLLLLVYISTLHDMWWLITVN